jgi:hypothetical protein
MFQTFLLAEQHTATESERKYLVFTSLQVQFKIVQFSTKASERWMTLIRQTLTVVLLMECLVHIMNFF